MLSPPERRIVRRNWLQELRRSSTRFSTIPKIASGPPSSATARSTVSAGVEPAPITRMHGADQTRQHLGIRQHADGRRVNQHPVEPCFAFVEAPRASDWKSDRPAASARAGPAVSAVRPFATSTNASSPIVDERVTQAAVVGNPERGVQGRHTQVGIDHEHAPRIRFAERQRQVVASASCLHPAARW